MGAPQGPSSPSTTERPDRYFPRTLKNQVPSLGFQPQRETQGVLPRNLWETQWVLSEAEPLSSHCQHAPPALTSISGASQGWYLRASCPASSCPPPAPWWDQPWPSPPLVWLFPTPTPSPRSLSHLTKEREDAGNQLGWSKGSQFPLLPWSLWGG